MFLSFMVEKLYLTKNGGKNVSEYNIRTLKHDYKSYEKKLLLRINKPMKNILSIRLIKA